MRFKCIIVILDAMPLRDQIEFQSSCLRWLRANADATRIWLSSLSHVLLSARILLHLFALILLFVSGASDGYEDINFWDRFGNTALFVTVGFWRWDTPRHMFKSSSVTLGNTIEFHDSVSESLPCLTHIFQCTSTNIRLFRDTKRVLAFLEVFKGCDNICILCTL